MQEHLLIRSAKSITGYKGVKADHGRYRAQCQASSCLGTHLGNFGTPEEAAQAILQHYQTEHTKQSLQVQEHLLIRSDKAKSGFKGVSARRGRYQAECNIAPCDHNYLGTFDIPEDAAQHYLQHYQEKHSEEDQRKVDERKAAARRKEDERVFVSVSKLLGNMVDRVVRAADRTPSDRVKRKRLPIDEAEDFVR